MIVHLGGSEIDARIAGRQRRYEVPRSDMLKIADTHTGHAVGSLSGWRGGRCG